jgi:hypothetical protein
MHAPLVDAFSEKEDLSEFKETEYWEACKTSRRALLEARKNGLSLSVWAKPSICHSRRHGHIMCIAEV